MPPKQAAPIEAGSSESSDLDSLYDSSSDTGSITDTLRSSWARERTKYLHGRRYHADEGDKNELVPNDEIQQDQQDLFHAVYTMAMSMDVPEGKPPRLYLSPIPEKPHRVLDVGTGTGIWAIDFADEHPSAEVTGFDKTPIQPTWVPPNLKFEIEDLANEWTYKPDTFDLVYLRAMHASISDWPKLLRQCFTVIKPGGYVEIYNEVPTLLSDDNSIPENWAFSEWLKTMNVGLNNLGLKTYIDTFIEKELEDAGFTNVKTSLFKLPLGPWPKDPKMKQLGAMFLVNMLQGLEGWTLAMYTQVLGKSHEETMKFVEDVKNALRNRKAHTYFNLLCVYAEKPGPATP